MKSGYITVDITTALPEDHNSKNIIDKSFILPITISLECGLVGQSRILYRTCDKRKVIAI